MQKRQCGIGGGILKKCCNDYPDLPTYKAQDFDRMIEEYKPDKVIVTSMDRTHHKYICRVMELGCDVISEKPMTINAVKDPFARHVKESNENLMGQRCRDQERQRY